MPGNERRPFRSAIHHYWAPSTIARPPLERADAHGFYAALGIQLRGRGQNRQTRCFANPDTHAQGDRHPSCSVSLIHGAWLCFGCGARGGAYDAACLRGYSPAGAMALLERFGLVEPGRRATRPLSRRLPPVRARRGFEPARVRLAVGEREVERYRRRLCDDERLLARLTTLRGWTREAIEALGVGFDGARVTFPLRDSAGGLVGLLRYQPDPLQCSGPKVLADPGSRRELFPAPEATGAGELVLVEGEPDAVAAWSAGRLAVAIPGVAGWRCHWADRFAGRSVLVVFDADAQGRAAASRVAGDLAGAAVRVRAVDLFPERDDGSDLTDYLLERRARSAG